MLTYETAVERLYELGHELHGIPSHKFDLAHMRVLLEAIGHPEKKFSSVLIAGTNGKGSTAAMLSSMLRAAGFKTGLYTSPHLVHINERIRINGEAIPNDEFTAVYEWIDAESKRLVVEGKLPWHPSFFETVTAMAFEYFANKGIQIAVLEVGMGGRLDATNVVEPCVSVITDISLDHQKFLGNTIAEIAAEKAGIVRKDRPAVTLAQHPQANEVLGKAIIEAGARGVSAAKNVPPISPGSENWFERSGDRTRFRMTVMGEEIEIDTTLSGRHQLRNIALAITAAEELGACGFSITPKQVERGIRETDWPGRFQVLPATNERPEIVLDVAHNPAGAWALRAALTERYPDRRMIVVFGAMRDKAIAEVAGILFPVAERVFATHAAHNPRAATAEDILKEGERTGAYIVTTANVQTALERAFAAAREIPDSLVAITGSIYIVGEAMELLKVRIS